MQKHFCYFSLSIVFIFLYVPIVTAALYNDTNIPIDKKSFIYNCSFSSPNDPELAKAMNTYSQLIQLKNQPPQNRIGIELRIKEDIAIGKKLLSSKGYYNGQIEQSVDWGKKPILIQLLFVPNIQYTVGKTNIYYEEPQLPSLPQTLSFFKIYPDSPAIAKDILTAVDSSLDYLHNNGYPLAKIKNTEYLIDHIIYTINVNVYIQQGNLMYMGKVNPQGAPNVSTTFLNKLIPWEIGRLWDDTYISIYENRLQQTGLFSSITLTPSNKIDKDDTTPIELAVREAPSKTLSAGVIYSSDDGPGFRGSWVHRNLFGNGENLNLTAPISKKNKQLLAIFRKPVFGSPRQTLVSEAELRDEKTTAYDQKFFSSAVGLERQLNRYWSATTKLSFNIGTLNDKILPKEPFFYFGIPVAFKRDTTNAPLNPTKGIKLTLATTPYTGKYRKKFTTLQTRTEFSTYFTPMQSEILTIAGKISIGSLLGKDITRYPANLRFYSGGGGTVRGYDYQSIGPKNIRGKPLGGLSSLTVSFELRFKLTDTIGIVPFIDGGNVYDQQLPKLNKPLFWGLGLGLRYYSSIAPIRIDIATPLENRKHNKALQFYISIGQTF